MRRQFFNTAFTPSVQAEQARHGSRASYARLTTGGPEEGDGLTEAETAFIAARDSFYLGTVSETGWPHVQHRGGPPGFVQVLGPRTLAWADFVGNRQYVSVGNAAANDRVAMIFVDYPARQRLKILGRMTVAEIADRRELKARLDASGYRVRVEHAVQVEVEAFDWNCPQHITPRFTAEQVEAAVAPLRRRLAELEGRIVKGDGLPA